MDSVGWSALTSGADRQVHSNQARLLRLVVSSFFNDGGVNQVWHVEPDGVRSRDDRVALIHTQ